MTKQIAVKLPDSLVDEIDRLVDGGTFASRSAAVRRGLEAMVAAQRREEIDRRYRAAAGEHPESREEVDEATKLAIASIDDEPWDRWW